ncbi:MAG: TRAP transporter large permease subunit, partial [Rhodospirillales bacterium]
IGRLFMAGIIPGILLTCLFLLAIAIVTRIKPEIGPAGPVSNFKDKIKSLRKAFTMVAIVLATIGGIYSGVFTPVEAAGVGAVLAFCVTLYRKSLDREKMSFVVLQTLQTTATVFMILIGAHVFIPFMALTHILEGLAMLVLTLPVAFEVITQLGMSPIWFGIVVVIVLEMGLISPPVGLNVFVVKSVAQDVSMGTIFRGIWPFWIAMGLCLIILVAFPQIATFLPDRMFDN